MNAKNRNGITIFSAVITFYLLCASSFGQAPAKAPIAKGANAAKTAPDFVLPSLGADKVVTEADCTADKLGSSIPVAAIGEPVSGVTLQAPLWTAATKSFPAYCSVNGSMLPVDTAANAKPINFRVVLPASWSYRAAQMGGSGNNGVIPNLLGNADPVSRVPLVRLGFATYGSDSGHQADPSVSGSDDWALNDEAIMNLGYLQLKKTHDAAEVLIEKIYGEKPRFNYFFGTSQGGREALTVAQRYPADYDGIAANAPIVNFSSLMLAPELIRIQEKALANWVPPAKINAIIGEFMRQCDKLDGLADGIINNYMACRAIFDSTQSPSKLDPWNAKRCPDNVDPDPGDISADACLTDGQIATLRFVYSRYRFARPLANGVKSFGMWVPNTDPASGELVLSARFAKPQANGAKPSGMWIPNADLSGSALIQSARFLGQEGAGQSAPVHSHPGVLGVTGFLMKNLNANPLDYVEGGALDARRRQISQWLDATNPNLNAFYKRGGKLIVVIGTNDTLASPGAQLDYYQSVLEKMGRKKVDAFARLFVLPQTNHELGGTNYTVDGDGKPIKTVLIPNAYKRLSLLIDWVEKKVAPPKSVTVIAGNRSLPMCSYPAYPKYVSGPVTRAESYVCAER